jgi:hypothetical protein
MYETNLPFVQAEIAYRTEQIGSDRRGKQRWSRLARVRRGTVSSDALR